MKTINKFFLRDVRCFGGEHEFNIRPLTFLIGENSTGKSTILGCLQALGNFPNFPNYRNRFDSQVDFNFEPYQMGTFTDIVRRSTPRKEDFQLGIEYESAGKRLQIFLTLTERSRGSEPIIRDIKWDFIDEGQIIFSLNEKNQDRKKGIDVTYGENQAPTWTAIDVTYGENQNVFRVSSDSDNPWIVWKRPDLLPEFLPIPLRKQNEIERNFLQFLRRQPPFLHYEEISNLLRIHSIAPIRSKPKRTYDPLKETETSDGSEIPMTLLNLSTSSEKEWKTLRGQLLDFGRASGLFSDITIRKLGRSRSDPFQLQIKVRGPNTNLMDVGYGISQVLPILVRIFTGRDAKFLLQQPEVHLHPKAQAELTSLLVDINRTHKNSFVIETHSDTMIDRVRIEIMKGKIKPDDVSLIYLEPDGNQVKTHNISFDAQGNMCNVPDSYRDFFLDESDRLLGLKD